MFKLRAKKFYLKKNKSEEFIVKSEFEKNNKKVDCLSEQEILSKYFQQKFKSFIDSTIEKHHVDIYNSQFKDHFIYLLTVIKRYISVYRKSLTILSQLYKKYYKKMAVERLDSSNPMIESSYVLKLLLSSKFSKFRATKFKRVDEFENNLENLTEEYKEMYEWDHQKLGYYLARYYTFTQYMKSKRVIILVFRFIHNLRNILYMKKQKENQTINSNNINESSIEVECLNTEPIPETNLQNKLINKISKRNSQSLTNLNHSKITLPSLNENYDRYDPFETISHFPKIQNRNYKIKDKLTKELNNIKDSNLLNNDIQKIRKLDPLKDNFNNIHKIESKDIKYSSYKNKLITISKKGNNNRTYLDLNDFPKRNHYMTPHIVRPNDKCKKYVNEISSKKESDKNYCYKNKLNIESTKSYLYN